MVSAKEAWWYQPMREAPSSAQDPPPPTPSSLPSPPPSPPLPSSLLFIKGGSGHCLSQPDLRTVKGLNPREGQRGD